MPPCAADSRCRSAEAATGRRYIPNSGDRQEEDSAAISERAAKLLCLLGMADPAAGVDLMRVWRDNMRKWLSAVLLQPLSIARGYGRRIPSVIQA